MGIVTATCLARPTRKTGETIIFSSHSEDVGFYCCESTVFAITFSVSMQDETQILDAVAFDVFAKK